MDDLHEYEECVQIEKARCRLRQDCDEAGVPAFKDNFKEFDYDTCVAYAKEHCRTREIGGGDWETWNGNDVDDCAEAIVALSPTYCADLDPSIDETEWSFMQDACGFLDEVEEEEPEEDAGADEADAG